MDIRTYPTHSGIKKLSWVAIDWSTFDGTRGDGGIQGFGQTEDDAIVDLVRKRVDQTCDFGNLTDDRDYEDIT